MIRRRVPRWVELAARCALALLGTGCDVDGVTPACPEAGNCVTLPPSPDAGAVPSDDAAPSDAADGADEANAASP